MAAITIEQMQDAFTKLMDMQSQLLGAMQAGKEYGSSSGGGGDNKKEVLFGKGHEMMDKFSGGETGWNEWSGHFRTVVQTNVETAVETLVYIKTEGNAENEMMSLETMVESMKADVRKKAEDEFETEDEVRKNAAAVGNNVQRFGNNVEGTTQVVGVEDGR